MGTKIWRMTRPRFTIRKNLAFGYHLGSNITSIGGHSSTQVKFNSTRYSGIIRGQILRPIGGYNSTQVKFNSTRYLGIIRGQILRPIGGYNSTWVKFDLELKKSAFTICASSLVNFQMHAQLLSLYDISTGACPHCILSDTGCFPNKMTKQSIVGLDRCPSPSSHWGLMSKL